ncbi:cation diffusion facilitator family transporter [Fervidibacillus halotolerans]|uniref:Cation diffusion facilitator family transporter n=1 Tax=Fervidibacillus halotolerans TaxID=2980027 RepID=A0A9E8S0U2_9BACI|nr:cation diffusion facilitator family transporter [Fervidibacillus halotolerans]WAA12887.1 cation diffusion facilitator family transporter [Fervidibacillus halotolerans]
MIKFFIKKFIKDYEHVQNPRVRTSYGILSGVLGIICNIFLFIIKLITGVLINSIAVISDAFNNLTDSGSSLITIIGANFSRKPPDVEHPYGHGRSEYIASLIVAFLIFAVGLELMISSVKKIFEPEPVIVNGWSIAILFLAVFIKLWMYSYNKFIGKTIQSTMNMATAKDSLNDAIATLGVIFGTFIGMFVDFPIDGFIGLIISFFIIFTGFSTAKDSVHFLLGSSPDPEIIERIHTIISDSEKIRAAHDLHVHDYGPGRKYASMHVVVPPDLNVEAAHFLIHELEQRIKKELGIDIVIHIDPMEGIDEWLAEKEHETNSSNRIE